MFLYWKIENNTKDTLERRCQNVNITFLLEVISEPRFLAPTLPTPTREHPHYISSNSRHISTFLHSSIIYIPITDIFLHLTLTNYFPPIQTHFYIFTLSNYFCLNSRQIFTLLHLSQFHISRFFYYSIVSPQKQIHVYIFAIVSVSIPYRSIHFTMYFLSNFFCQNYLFLPVFLQQEVKCAVTNPRLTESFLITFNMFRR